MTSHTLHSSKTTINHVMTMHRASMHANILSWSPVLLMMFPAAVIKCNTKHLKGGKSLFLSWSDTTAHSGGEVRATAGHIITSTIRKRRAMDARCRCFSPFIRPRIAARKQCCPCPRCEELPTQNNLIKKILNRHAQKPVSQVVLDHVTDFQKPRPYEWEVVSQMPCK